jgi:hypothetical protein
LTLRRQKAHLKAGAVNRGGQAHNSLVIAAPGKPMHQEAEVFINGSLLSEEESMTLRMAIDTFANALAEEGIGLADNRTSVTGRYMASLSRIQLLLENPATRNQ